MKSPDKDEVLTALVRAWEARNYMHPVQKIAALQCLMHELWEMAESGNYQNEVDTFEFWQNLNESSR